MSIDIATQGESSAAGSHSWKAAPADGGALRAGRYGPVWTSASDADIAARAAELEDEDVNSIKIDKKYDITALLQPMPQCLPESTSNPALDKIYGQLVKLESSCSAIIRQGVRSVCDILDTVAKARHFRTLAINLCLRTLRFFLKLARIEKRSQARTPTGTLGECFYCSQTSIGMHLPLATHSARRLFKNEMQQIAKFASYASQQSWITPDHLLFASMTFPFLGAISAEDFPGYDSGSRRAINQTMLIGNIRCVAEDDLRLDRLPRATVKLAQASVREAWSNIITIVNAVGAAVPGFEAPSLDVLHRLLVDCFRTDVGFAMASKAAELITAQLRSSFDLVPSHLNRWRLVGGLSVLSMTLALSRQSGAALEASAEAIRLFQPLLNANTYAMGTSLYLVHLFLLLYLDREGRSLPRAKDRAHSAERLRHMRCISSHAVRLARTNLLRAPSEWENQDLLARALGFRAKVLRKSFGPSQAEHSITLRHLDEEIKLCESAAQMQPLLFEPALCDSYVSRMDADSKDVALITELGGKALAICERWKTAWPQHMHSTMSSVFLELRQYGAAQAAITTCIELRASSASRHAADYMGRARVEFALGQFEAALGDIEKFQELNKSNDRGVQAAAMACRGYTIWIVGLNAQAKDAVELLVKSVQEFKLCGHAECVGDGGKVTNAYVLALCWLAAAQSAVGEVANAKQTVQLAIDLIQANSPEHNLHKESSLACALLFSAAVHFEDADEMPEHEQWTTGKERLMEAVELIKDGGPPGGGNTWTDGPTKRTIWLLLGHVLEMEGLQEEADEARREADKAGFHDFAHRIGFSALDTR
ncbi:hypothetical protein OC835_001696 [Tilletia horrida]|nr:hypothetical protein OC835_001696 [Tilletia horrida]